MKTSTLVEHLRLNGYTGRGVRIDPTVNSSLGLLGNHDGSTAGSDLTLLAMWAEGSELTPLETHALASKEAMLTSV